MPAKPAYEELQKKIRILQKDIERHKKRVSDMGLIQERLSQIVDSVSIPTFVIDSRHKVTHYNRAMENLTGIPAAEIIGTDNQWKAFYSAKRLSMADLIVDNATEKTIAKHYKDNYQKSAVLKGAYEAEGFFPEIGENGKWLFFTAAPLLDSKGKIYGAVETLQDITERKQAEDNLIKSERRFRTLLDFAPYSIVVFDMDGCVTYLNPTFTDTFGWTFAELKGKRIPYVPEELKKDISKNVQRLVEEKVLLRHETKRLTKDGRIRDVVMRASVFNDSRGQPAGELVIIRDVTQEKRIARNNEAMLRISMALPEYFELYELFDYVSSVIKDLVGTEGGVAILLDEQRQELFFMGVAFEDKATEKRVKEFRFGLDELLAGKVIKTGQPMLLNAISRDSEIHTRRDRRLGYETRNLLLVPLRSQDRVIGVLCAINKKEGDFEQRDVELLSLVASSTAIALKNAQQYTALKQANDALREAQAQRIAAERWMVLGKAAGNLAHRINNTTALVPVTTQHLAELLEQVEMSPELRREVNTKIDRIQRNTLYTVDLAMALLRRFRHTPAEAQDVNVLVKQALGSIEIPPNVKVVCELDPELPPVNASNLLIDVFVELITNAIRAVAEQDGVLRIASFSVGERVSVQVTDNGPGIPSDKHRDIFDIFYTTNPQGLGFGLWWVKTFLEQQRGDITVESQAKGTTFTVTIPRNPPSLRS